MRKRLGLTRGWLSGGWRALTVLLLALAINSVTQTPLAQAAGSTSIGIYLRAQQVGARRTICVGDSVQIRLSAHKRVTGMDVAEAALFFVSDRSLKTTGSVLSVDGGVPGAFAR